MRYPLAVPPSEYCDRCGVEGHRKYKLESHKGQRLCPACRTWPVYMPTQEQITAATKAFQAEWSEERFHQLHTLSEEKTFFLGKVDQGHDYWKASNE